MLSKGGIRPRIHVEVDPGPDPRPDARLEFHEWGSKADPEPDPWLQFRDRARTRV